MFKNLKRWLGWGTESGLLDLESLGSRSRSSPPAPKQPTATPAAQRRTKTERSPRDVLDNPRLTLDKPPADGFDPYNTGAFNRSTYWERIGRQRKR